MRRNIQRGAKGILGDVLRKVPLSGVAEIRVPSDIRRVVVANVENLRENALDIFAKEVSKVLGRLDFQHIIDDVLKNYTLRLEAKVDFLPKGRKTKTSARKARK